VFQVRFNTDFVLNGYAHPLFVHFMIKENCVQSFLLPQLAPIILLRCSVVFSRRQP